MATATPSKLDEEILICSICLDTLKEPKILGCLHRFCKACVSKVIEQVPANDNVFSCPTCRHEVCVPDKGVEGLKSDFLLEDILESRALERGLKGEQKEHICSSCDEFSKIAAVCPDCGGFLCDACLQSHKTLKVLRSHSHVVTLADIQSGKVAFDANTQLLSSRTPKCTVHKDMPLHIYCKDCEKLICPVCAPIHHRSHELEEIETAAQRAKEQLNESLEEIQDDKDNLDTSLDEFKELTTERNASFEAIENEVMQHFAGREKDIITGRDAALDRVKAYEKAVNDRAVIGLETLQCQKETIRLQLKMMKEFYGSAEKNYNENIDSLKAKVKTFETTARILTGEADNWRLLLAAHDLQSSKKNLEDDISKVSEAETAVPEGGISWTFLGSRRFLFDEFEWYESNLEIPSDMNVKLLDVKCAFQMNKLAIVGTNVDDNCTVSAFFDIETSEVSGNSISDGSGLEEGISIAAVRQNSISIVKMDNTLVDGSKCGQQKSFIFDVDDMLVSCVEQIGDAEMIVAVRQSITLYKCNHECDVLSTIKVKVDGIKPPVSIASFKEGNILLCDGENHAVAIDAQGELKTRYRSRHSTDKAMKIVADRQNLVYVLWEVSGEDDGNDDNFSDIFKDTDDDVSNGDDSDDDILGEPVEIYNNNEEDEEDDVNLIVMQYTASGTFISDIEVDKNSTVMTTVYEDDDTDSLVVANPKGEIDINIMSDSLKALCKFIKAREESCGQNT